MVCFSRGLLLATFALCGWLGAVVPATSADLGPQPVEQLPQPVPPLNQWQFSFTPYLWLPWISGDVVVKGRTLDVAVDPAQVIDALNWPDIVPALMSYAEARRGPLSLFNDVVWADLDGSEGFSGRFHRRLATEKATATFGGDISVDYTLAIVEAGGAYAIWSRGSQGSPGSTAFDLLAGARYWHQEVDVHADLTATVALSGPLDLTISGSRATAKSGSVDWVDPFVGARLRQQLAPGQEFVLRGDVGGFGAGSQFSWQAIATYNSPLCEIHGIPVDGYVGFRALSADFSQGSGRSKFEWDNVIYGPVIGATMTF
jgi:hypothetical protein